MFKFRCAETTKEYFPHQFSKEDDKDKGLNINDGHTRIGLGDVNHRGVKLLPLKVGIAYDYSCEKEAGSSQERRPHHRGHGMRRIRQFEKIWFWLQSKSVLLFSFSGPCSSSHAFVFFILLSSYVLLFISRLDMLWNFNVNLVLELPSNKKPWKYVRFLLWAFSDNQFSRIKILDEKYWIQIPSLCIL